MNYCKFNRLNLYFGYLKTKNYSESSFVIWHKLYQSFASTVPLQVLYIYNAVHVKFGNKTHLSPLWLLSCLSKSFSFSVVGVII